MSCHIYILEGAVLFLQYYIQHVPRVHVRRVGGSDEQGGLVSDHLENSEFLCCTHFQFRVIFLIRNTTLK